MDTTLINELVEKFGEPAIARPEEFGITLEEIRQKKHCSKDTGRALLRNGVEAGILQMHMMIIAGKPGRVGVFHRPEEWPPKS